MKKDFFISYNQTDRPWAEWIAWVLEDAGYSTIIQAWDFLAGFNFIALMDDALKQSNRMIAILSPDYLSSKFTQPEWTAAFRQDPEGKQGKLVPVKVRECIIDGLLGPLTYIDLVGLSAKAAEEVLLMEINLGRKKPKEKPIYPNQPEKSKPLYPEYIQDSAEKTPLQEEPLSQTASGRTLSIFQDIRIIGINDNLTYNPNPNKLLYDIYLELSERPASAWRDIFQNQREFPRHSMWRKAWIDGNNIVIHCPLDELERYHKADLIEDVQSTNKLYRDMLFDQHNNELVEITKKQKEKDQLISLKKNINFD